MSVRDGFHTITKECFERYWDIRIPWAEDKCTKDSKYKLYLNVIEWEKFCDGSMKSCYEAKLSKGKIKAIIDIGAYTCAKQGTIKTI